MSDITTDLCITKPDDWHVHFRDGEMLRVVVPETARHFGRALVMPNLVPPVVTTAQALDYRDRIMSAVPKQAVFEPLMTVYLTDRTDLMDLRSGAESGLVSAVKLYPAGATTNSDAGVQSVDAVMPVLETMADIGLPLCVHGEVTDSQIDIFDREAVFIERILAPLHARLPELRIVMEHVTTRDGIDFVRASRDTVAATLTVHHLLINRTHIFAGGIKPHYYCLPIAKREEHRLALREAATSGDPKFFLGTDSAPHIDAAKESACGCAGCFTATHAMPCLAQIFEEDAALDKLEGFASLHGAAFYGVQPNAETLQLVRRSQPITWPKKLQVGAASVTLFDPATSIHWSVTDISTV